VVNAIPGELIPGDDPRVRTVYAVSPTGSITQGTTIDVTYYVGDFTEIPVEIPEPEPTETPVDPDDPNATPDPNATESEVPTETPTESTNSG
jgi:serine/threonine-protein kinase